MKVYVDELPKSCIDCPCESEYYCNLLNRDIEFLELTKGCKDCPLQSLTDYTKQVRKEVCERLDKRIHNYLSNKCRYAESLDIHSIITQVMKEDLDQIQGE